MNKIILWCAALSVLVLAAGGVYGEKVPAQPTVTFIELGSVNCMPCKLMQAVTSEIEQEYAESVKVVFYDVWTKEGAPYGKKYKVNAIPTQVFLDKNGNEFFRHQGFFPKEEIVKVLQTQGVTKDAKSGKSSVRDAGNANNTMTGTVCK